MSFLAMDQEEADSGLFAALAKWDFVRAARLVAEEGASVHGKGLNNQPMTFAAIHGVERVLDWLVVRGVGIDAFIADENGNPVSWRPTLLGWAVSKKDYALVAMALERGANPDFRGMSFLHAAVSENEAPIAELLIKAGANVNYRDEHEETTVFEEALKTGEVYLAKMILEAGADPTPSNDAPTLLHFVIEQNERSMKYGGKPMLLWLITELGVDPNTPNASGQHPLHIAISQRKFAWARILIENGADTYSPVTGYGNRKMTLNDFVGSRVDPSTLDAYTRMIGEAEQTWRENRPGDLTKRARYAAKFSSLFG